MTAPRVGTTVRQPGGNSSGVVERICERATDCVEVRITKAAGYHREGDVVIWHFPPDRVMDISL